MILPCEALDKSYFCSKIYLIGLLQKVGFILFLSVYQGYADAE